MKMELFIIVFNVLICALEEHFRRYAQLRMPSDLKLVYMVHKFHPVVKYEVEHEPV